MYINRTLTKNLDKISKSFPVLLITGPRQVGKTTLLQHASQDNRRYVTLDDPVIRALAKDDPALFIQKYPAPILIDEIQYAPELFPLIKMQVDQSKIMGAYWLTGAQQFNLMKNITESLAGRVGILKLQGFSQSEKFNNIENKPFLPGNDYSSNIPNKLDALSIYEYIWRGSFPVMSSINDMDHNLFYSSYVQTYLQRDVRDLTNAGSEQSFLRFLRATAARSGQLINFADLARDADVSPVTAKAWLSILESSGLIYLLEPYYNNRIKRLVKKPKLYFLDTGLCCYLTGWTSPQTLEIGAFSGAILETYIISELLKSYWHAGLDAPFFYFRDKDKKEIDLLIYRDGLIYPLEFKKTASPHRNMIRNFDRLENIIDIVGNGSLICLTQNIVPLTKNVDAIPVSYI